MVASDADSQQDPGTDLSYPGNVTRSGQTKGNVADMAAAAVAPPPVAAAAELPADLSISGSSPPPPAPIAQPLRQQRQASSSTTTPTRELQTAPPDQASWTTTTTSTPGGRFITSTAAAAATTTTASPPLDVPSSSTTISTSSRRSGPSNIGSSNSGNSDGSSSGRNGGALPPIHPSDVTDTMTPLHRTNPNSGKTQPPLQLEGTVSDSPSDKPSISTSLTSIILPSPLDLSTQPATSAPVTALPTPQPSTAAPTVVFKTDKISVLPHQRSRKNTITALPKRSTQTVVDKGQRPRQTHSPKEINEIPKGSMQEKLEAISSSASSGKGESDAEFEHPVSSPSPRQPPERAATMVTYHQQDKSIISAVNNVPVQVSFVSVPPVTPPLPSGGRGNAHPPDTNTSSSAVFKTAVTTKSMTPINKSEVVTWAHPVGAGQKDGVPIAVIIVPVVCVALLVGIGLLVFLRRRKRRAPGYKRRLPRDEESSTDASSSLANDSNSNDKKAPVEALYAIVDKTKKRRNTESTSNPDESVPLVTVAQSVTAQNESCPVITTRDVSSSKDTLSTHSMRGSRSQDVVFIVPGDTQEPLYDVPPVEDDDLATTEYGSEELRHKISHGDPLTQSGLNDNGPNAALSCKESGRHTPFSPANIPHLPHYNEGDSGEGDDIPQHDVTLVECDLYEGADHYDPNRDDEDGMYEIPDSPATVRARRSVATISRLLDSLDPDSSGDDNCTTTTPAPAAVDNAPAGDEQLNGDDGGHPASKTALICNTTRQSFALPITDERLPQRIVSTDGNTSDSSSSFDSDSDFEDLWPTQGDDPGGRPEVAKLNGIAARHNNDTPPPVPKLLPEVDTEYLFPKCHPHCPPGPNWKPFHEYDPVYVPHSDPLAMDKRVDSQNYVRGRQRSDSRQTNPYEEIQFGAIYDTVDDDDVFPSASGGPRNLIPVPPRMPRAPSPPPPLVPRRIRPFSGMADVGPNSVNKPLPEPEPEATVEVEKRKVGSTENWLTEPRYSGLIMEDVSDREDTTPHEYTTLNYTRLRSVGRGPLLNDDDIKAMDDTDSETYQKESFTSSQHPDHIQETHNNKTNYEKPDYHRPSHEPQVSEGSPRLQQAETEQRPPLPPRLIPARNRNSTNGNIDVTPYKLANGHSDYKAEFVFPRRNAETVKNGNNGDSLSTSSSDSDDSYEPVDFCPPEAARVK